MRFTNRRAAGQALAEALAAYRGRDDLTVLALPRGGLPVANEIASVLDAELDVLLVRKLGVPWHPELAMGAIASGGRRVMNDDVVRSLGIPEADIRQVEAAEREELERRAATYRGARPWPELAGRCVILVDDGLATGATMLAAVEAVRQELPAHIVVAVPVAPPDTVRRLRAQVDELVCLHQPVNFMAVGAWYVDFNQVGDDEVRRVLAAAWSRGARALAGAAEGGR